MKRSDDESPFVLFDKLESLSESSIVSAEFACDFVHKRWKFESSIVPRVGGVWVSPPLGTANAPRSRSIAA